MNAEPASAPSPAVARTRRSLRPSAAAARRDRLRDRLRSALAASLATASASAAAQVGAAPPSAASGAVERSGLMQAFDRLDPLGIALVAGAAVILLLLVLRIFAMVRGERPVHVPEPARRRAARTDDRPADDAAPRGSTDWGQDQNKRAAQAREAIATGIALPSLDQSVTQWTISDVHNAATASRQVGDSLGKPPDAASSPYRTAFNPYYQGDARAPSASDVEVVEVADTLLQAELLVQLGDPKQAMTLLSNHIRETAKPGPAVWLMLLNLYQATGRKSQYEALAIGFKTLFNAQVPAWATSKDVASRDIESYPQVMMRLHTSWGKPGVRPLIDGLLNDDRGGSRQGFSLAAYRDLLFLLEICNQLDRMGQEDADRARIRRKLEKEG